MLADILRRVVSISGFKGIFQGSTVIATSTAVTATAYSNQRKVDRCQNGVLWSFIYAARHSNFATGFYSTDNGTTWTNAGVASELQVTAGGSAGFAPNFSFFIDIDDYAHAVYKARDNGFIYYRRGTPNAGRTEWTWSGSQLVDSIATMDYPDLIAHREGTGWEVHVVASRPIGSSSAVTYYKSSINSSGTIGGFTNVVIAQGGYSNTLHKWPSIDFHHTGDSKTVAGGTPHIYVAWSSGNTGFGRGIRFRKATYSGGSWTWGTEREIDSTKYLSADNFYLNCLFDGARVYIAGFTQGTVLVLYERDVADTTTTTHVVEDLTSNAERLHYGTSTYSSDGNVYFFGGVYDGTNRQAAYREWVRATEILGDLTVIDSPTANLVYFSAKRGDSNGRIEFIYPRGSSSPFDVTYGSIA